MDRKPDKDGITWYPMAFGNYDVDINTGELTMRKDIQAVIDNGCSNLTEYNEMVKA